MKKERRSTSAANPSQLDYLQLQRDWQRLYVYNRHGLSGVSLYDHRKYGRYVNSPEVKFILAVQRLSSSMTLEALVNKSELQEKVTEFLDSAIAENDFGFFERLAEILRTRSENKPVESVADAAMDATPRRGRRLKNYDLPLTVPLAVEKVLHGRLHPRNSIKPSLVPITREELQEAIIEERQASGLAILQD